jgi:hypothetical protein
MSLTDTRVKTLTTGNRPERLVVDTNGLYLHRMRDVAPSEIVCHDPHSEAAWCGRRTS